jgi:hypothetical protein
VDFGVGCCSGLSPLVVDVGSESFRVVAPILSQCGFLSDLNVSRDSFGCIALDDS